MRATLAFFGLREGVPRTGPKRTKLEQTLSPPGNSQKVPAVPVTFAPAVPRDRAAPND